MITRRIEIATAQPSHLWLKGLAARPMSPIARELRKIVAEEILLDKNDSNFPTKLIDAWQKYGFAVVRDSSIDRAVFSNAYGVNRRFFSNQIEYKEQLGHPSATNCSGYIPPGEEISVSGRGDGKVQKNIFEMVHSSSNPKDNTIINDNLGREFNSSSNRLVDLLYERGLELAHDIAIGLHEKGFLTPSGGRLPDDYFTKLIECTNRNRSDLNLLRQTHCNAQATDSTNFDGCSQAHTDLNFFTVLPAATKEGLQIWYENEERPEDSGWVQLDAPPGAYVVNLADMAEILTGGYLRSTPHRVVSPIGEDRYSIVFFVGLQRDANLQENKLKHPSMQATSSFETEALARMPGLELTADTFTNLRCMDIGIIPEKIGKEKLGFIPLSEMKLG
ncbi:MAG: isopenicillin N synthase family oxygenase [Candidatus Melainabacteria bacterium]|nr:isopenicillin N synthase family oxygenase [Candidatus Melainabacteria bacterium]